MKSEIQTKIWVKGYSFQLFVIPLYREIVMQTQHLFLSGLRRTNLTEFSPCG